MSTKNNTMLSQKKARFLSALKYAVVGASTDPSKNGSKALKWLVEQHKDVTPVNLKATEIQGIKCVKALSELPDPTHTSVSIVVHPETTLQILQQAKALGIFALWLQPGAEDDAVVKFIQADAQLDERCIYRAQAVHEHPSRTRSKPEPLTTSTNLPAKLAENITVQPDTGGPCILVADPVPTESAPVENIANVGAESLTVQPDTGGPCGDFISASLDQKKTVAPLDQKKARFLSAPKFAVVGASSNSSKNGSKALKWLIEHGKDVVPINLKAIEIQGIQCLKTLSQLPDPTHTSVSVVVPPTVTLEIVKQARALDIFALWLQPGAEDDAVVEFIEADAHLNERCIYRTHAMHASGLFVSALVAPPQQDIDGCLWYEPSPKEATPAAVGAPLVASNLAAGVKHDMLSPPSTPPVTKSLKLNPDDSMHKSEGLVSDLGEEIPGLA